MNESSGSPEGFSPIACLNCRKAHRKCDRQLPQCSECTCRNLHSTCNYANPKKRGPKQLSPTQSEVKIKRIKTKKEEDELPFANGSSSFTFHAQPKQQPLYSSFSVNGSPQPFLPTPRTPETFIPMEQLEKVDQITYKHHGKLLLDFYYSVMTFGFPAAPRPQIDYFLENINCYHTPSFRTNIPLTQTQEITLTMMESIEIIVLQRIGRKRVAEELYQITRLRIGKLFEEVSDSYELAISLIMLADYLCGTGLIKQARIYQNIGKIYFDEHTDSATNVHARSGFFYAKTNEIVLAKNDVVDQIRRVGNIILSWNTGKESFDMNSLDSTRYGTDLEYLQAILKLIDSMEQQTKIFYYENSKTIKSCPILETNENVYKLSSQLSLGDLQYEMVMIGLRLKVLTQVGMWNSVLVKQCADKISHMTQSPWFDSCAIVIVESVVHAAMVHLNDQSTQGWFLATDLRALQSLDQKFDVVTRTHFNLVNNLRERANAVQMQQTTENPNLMSFLSIEKDGHKLELNTNDILTSINMQNVSTNGYKPNDALAELYKRTQQGNQ